MKRILLLAMLMLAPALALAQTQDVLYLKNGNVVRGAIIESSRNGSVAIQTPDGKVLTYTQFDIRQIKQESAQYLSREPHAQYQVFEEKKSGYFFAAELSGGVSLEGTDDMSFPVQLGVVNGYRFNEYISVGLGLGARYYTNNKDVRNRGNEFVFPIYLDLRGNFIARLSRNMAPYWSLDAGYTINDDNFMFSPTVGMSFGGKRNNLLVGVYYTGQVMEKYGNESKNRIFDILGLKLGYQF